MMKDRKNLMITVAKLVILLFVSFILTFLSIIFFDKSILVLSFNHGKNNFTSSTYTRLTKGHAIKGEFTAQENNLGIVAIRFQSFVRIPYKDEDTLIFRIKERGAADWYYENHYRSGLIYDVPFLPFGFPKIANSKNKIYDFELVSLYGNQKNGVALSNRMPNLTSRYQADKNILLKNHKELFNFLFSKLYNSFQTLDILFSALVFSLPFLIYLIYLPSIYKHWGKHFDKAIKRVRRSYLVRGLFGRITLGANYKLQTLTVICWILLFINVLFFQVQNGILFVFIFFVELFLYFKFKYSPEVSYYFGIFLLLLTPILLVSNKVNRAELSAAWAFIYLSVAVVESILQTHKRK